MYFLISESNFFWGDLTDISAKTAILPSVASPAWSLQPVTYASLFVSGARLPVNYGP